MEFGAVIEIIIAVFAVFGMICLLKFAADKLFTSHNVVVAAKILDRSAADEADVLIEMIKDSSKGLECCLLIGREMLDDEDLMSLVELSGIEYYVVEK